MADSSKGRTERNLNDEDQAKSGIGKRKAGDECASVGTLGALSEAARLKFLVGEGTVVMIKEATSWVITRVGAENL